MRARFLLVSLALAGCGRARYVASEDAGVGDVGPVDAARPPAPRCTSGTFGTLRAIDRGAEGSDTVTSPSLSPDGLTLFYLDAIDYRVRELRRPSIDAPFVGAPAPSAEYADLPPELRAFHTRADGLERFVGLADGSGHSNLFVQTRARLGEAWSTSREVLSLGVTVNTADANEWDPFLVSDGLTLWFQREPPAELVRSGAAQIHLHRLRRVDRDASFGALETIDVSAAGPTPGSPTLVADGSLLAFSDDGAIFVAPLVGETVGAPVALTELDPDPMDLHFDYEPHLRSDGCELFWVRDVSGRQELFQATRAP